MKMTYSAEKKLTEWLKDIDVDNSKVERVIKSLLDKMSEEDVGMNEFFLISQHIGTMWNQFCDTNDMRDAAMYSTVKSADD